MTAGEAKIAAAMANGIRDVLNAVEAQTPAPDLTEALAATGTGAIRAAQPRTIRRGALEWIRTAKTP